jgi:uncharacterized protein YidB (DUF937 family)
MGLLDDVMGMAGMGSTANAQSQQHAGALGMLLEYIDSPQVGGISGLQQMFQQKGLGGVISSWIGTGQNLPISTAQLQSVLHSESCRISSRRQDLTKHRSHQYFRKCFRT